ncbi:MAG: phosphatase PAP2 family protein [Bdellovibrionales bacterium]
MLHSFLAHLTTLGDSGFLAALTFFCALYLYLTDNKRAAFLLCAALLSCMGIMGLLKIYFLNCHQHYPTWNLKSPSGHAAMSAAIYGTLAALLAKKLASPLREAAILGAILLILTIAVSRILLGHHSQAEVLVGLAVGTSIAFTSTFFLRPLSNVSFRTRHLALIGMGALILLYGTHAPAEILIRKIAQIVYRAFPFCS